MNKLSLPFIAFLQVLGVALYVVLFVLTARGASMYVESVQFPEITFPIIFLLAFVFSALTCLLIVFGFPSLLVLEGKGKEALKIVILTAAWPFVAVSTVLILLLL